MFENYLKDGVPGISSLYKKGRNAFFKGNDFKIYENLIYLLHNSSISIEMKVGEDVHYAYGGIGIVIHKDAVLSNGVMVGQNITIGGGGVECIELMSFLKENMCHLLEIMFI